MSTPLMELEREILGVLETVSAVNDFRSLNKTINIFFKKARKKNPTSPPVSYRKELARQ